MESRALSTRVCICMPIRPLAVLWSTFPWPLLNVFMSSFIMTLLTILAYSLVHFSLATPKCVYEFIYNDFVNNFGLLICLRMFN